MCSHMDMFFVVTASPFTVGIILKIYIGSGTERVVEVPITPSTSVGDIVCCCTPPGEECCHLVENWRGSERPVSEEEVMNDILNEWGVHRDEVTFHLQRGQPGPQPTATGQVPPIRRNGVRDYPDAPNLLPSGVDLTLGELQEMAARQQQQIDQQQKLLVAKEQRLRFLKQEELRRQQLAGENERLRKLRERVEAQEAKLRKLRALRGEATEQVSSNTTLTSELESVKSMFHEKEKELVTAVTKVDELTKQLEDLRQGKVTSGNSISPNQNVGALADLEKLRKELAMRDKLNEQQTSKLSAHHEVLQLRKDEMTRLDQKIADLQSRVKSKKQASLTAPNKQEQDTKPTRGGRILGSNVASVEPYIKIPPKDENEEENLKGLIPTKQDPKYQTLPHSIKFKVDDTLKKSSLGNNIYDVGLKKHEGISSNNKTSSTKDSTDSKTTDGQKVENQEQEEQRKAHPPSYQSIMGMVNKQKEGVYSRKDMPPPPATSSEVTASWSNVTPSTRISSLMTNFAPRPYVSSFSTPSSSDKNATKSSASDSSLMLTPSSSISSPKTSTPISQVSKEQPPLPGQEPFASRPKQMVPGTASTTTVTATATIPSTSTYTTIGATRGILKASAPSSQPSLYNDSSLQHNSISSNTQTPYKDTSSSVQQPSTRPNPPATAVPISVTHTTKPMYASKSVIANTYMRKLGPNALEQYRKNMSQIYQGFTPTGGDAQKMSGGDRNSPPNSSASLQQSLGPPSSPSRRGPTPVNGTDSDPSRNNSNGAPMYQREPPPYKNIDPVKFRPNAPRIHRRRLSSGGDSPQHPHGDDHRSHSHIQVPSPDDNVFVESSKDLTDGSKLTVIPPDILQGDQSSSKQNHVGHSSPESSPYKLTSPVSSPVKEKSERLPLVLRRKKTNLKSKDSAKNSRRVSFDPLALLLDASLEGELELVKKTAQEVPDPSCPNDEGITALHNAICAGHYEIVKFLVEFGCNVNAPDSDGWTPLHCAASCNNLPMVKVLVEHGACIFATTISDHETAAEKCEEDEDGYDGCSEYLYNIQEKLGILNAGAVYAVFDYRSQNPDELDFDTGDKLSILRKGDETEKEWWWAKKSKREGYIPRNLLGLYPRASPQWLKDGSSSGKQNGDK